MCRLVRANGGVQPFRSWHQRGLFNYYLGWTWGNKTPDHKKPRKWAYWFKIGILIEIVFFSRWAFSVQTLWKSNGQQRSKIWFSREVNLGVFSFFLGKQYLLFPTTSASLTMNSQKYLEGGLGAWQSASFPSFPNGMKGRMRGFFILVVTLYPFGPSYLYVGEKKRWKEGNRKNSLFACKVDNLVTDGHVTHSTTASTSLSRQPKGENGRRIWFNPLDKSNLKINELF